MVLVCGSISGSSDALSGSFSDEVDALQGSSSMQTQVVLNSNGMVKMRWRHHTCVMETTTIGRIFDQSKFL